MRHLTLPLANIEEMQNTDELATSVLCIVYLRTLPLTYQINGRKIWLLQGLLYTLGREASIRAHVIAVSTQKGVA